MSDHDCCANTGGASLKTLEQALELLLSHASPVNGTERVDLSEARGRVLAEPVASGVTVPPWDNSAMDGYAVNVQGLSDGARLPVVQRIAAGTEGVPLAHGGAARIFTGAPIPRGADAVVIQEACRVEGGDVVLLKVPKAGANIRCAGEDMHLGEVVLEPGIRLAPQHLGLAAAVGAASLSVHRRLKVAIFSTGDELVPPGQPLGPGQIYNSNEFTLRALLEGIGCEVVSLGIVADSFDATCEALLDAADRADLMMTSGGVSVGEEDHLKPAVEHLGSLDLWKIAIRPGKPLAFGHVRGTPFIGTPGNPVSLFVTFCLLARPFILKSQGVADSVAPRPIRARAAFDWPAPDRRREFARARIALDQGGAPLVELYPSRSSGVLSGLAWANGLAVLPEGRALASGDSIEFLPFSELMA